MAKGKHRIKAGQLENKSAIKPGTPARANLSFSFRYIDSRHSKFDYSGRNSNYFCKMLERLSALSTTTFKELMAGRSGALRVHPIDWSGTSEPEGFGHLNEQLKESAPFQFSISGNEHGRVHGFFIDSVFYVVWLDPSHNLYP